MEVDARRAAKGCVSASKFNAFWSIEMHIAVPRTIGQRRSRPCVSARYSLNRANQDTYFLSAVNKIQPGRVSSHYVVSYGAGSQYTPCNVLWAKLDPILNSIEHINNDLLFPITFRWKEGRCIYSRCIFCRSCQLRLQYNPSIHCAAQFWTHGVSKYLHNESA